MATHVHIVPGSFTVPQFYIPLRDAVIAAGYEASITPLLSAGKRDGHPPATMEDDAQHIRKANEALLKQGKDVVLVMHSYGGIPGTESVEGLLKTEREAGGKAGGIIRLVYLTALAPEVGRSINDVMAPLMEKYKDVSYVKIEVCHHGHWTIGSLHLTLDDKGDYMSHEPELSAKYTFSDLPFEDGLALAKQMPHHSAISFNGKLTYPAYKDVAVSYITCTQDFCVPLELQRSMIQLIEKESGRKVHVQELASGHCPMSSRPVDTAKLIKTAVEQAVGMPDEKAKFIAPVAEKSATTV